MPNIISSHYRDATLSEMNTLNASLRSVLQTWLLHHHSSRSHFTQCWVCRGL